MKHRITKRKIFSGKFASGKGPLTRSQTKSFKSTAKSSTRLKSLRNKSLSIKNKSQSIKSKSKSIKSKSKSIRSQPSRNISIKSTRRVKINTPENEILEYTLGTSEKEWKQKTPVNRDIPKCKINEVANNFPCKYKRTIFKSKKDYNDWKNLKYERNISTGYKSRGEHYDDVDSLLLSRENNSLLRK
jgi:hypothetical protein